MSEEVKLQKTSRRHTFPKGEAWNGNRKGRPRKPEIELLREALKEAENEKGIPFLKHFVLKAYSNHNVAIALAKKLIPDQIKGEGFGNDSTTIYNIINEIREARIARTVGSSSVELDNGHGLHEGRARLNESHKEIPKQTIPGADL